MWAMPEMRNVICMKWGTAYSPQYVNVLFNAVRDRLSDPFRFICFTDDGTELLDGIEVYDIPDMKLPQSAFQSGGWPKLAIFAKELYDIRGRCLFIDLDTLIVGKLDRYFDDAPGIRVIKTATPRHLFWKKKVTFGGTGVIGFSIGTEAQIYNSFMGARQTAISDYKNEQDYACAFASKVSYWDGKSVALFKHDICAPGKLRYLLRVPKPAAETSIVAFHGYPNPSDLIDKSHGHNRLTPTGGYVDWVDAYWKAYS